MPQLIRTPEQIFRDERKDLYLIRMCQGDGDDAPGWQEIQDWLREHAPNSPVEPLAPSEDSGWVMGYLGDLRVDFTPEDLATFCARWEDGNGNSIDPRFQCYLWPFAPWYAEQYAYLPTRDQPTTLGSTVWWEIPGGYVYHQLPDTPEGTVSTRRHPLSAPNLWLRAVDCWPELAALNPRDLVRGWIERDDDSGRWTVFYETPSHDLWGFDRERQAALQTWFGLPANTDFISDR